MIKYKSYIKSYLLLLGFFLLYFCVGVNLYFIQVRQQHFFSTLGEKQYNITVTTHPPRAAIYDCKNRPLAINKKMLSAFILPQEIDHPKETSVFLEKYFPESHERLQKSSKSKFFFVKRNLTKSEAELIQDSNLPDIHILEEPSRFYPHPATSTIIGLTDIENNGTLGLEQQYDKQLAGIPTTYFLKKDARSKHFYFHKETTQEGKEGIPLDLTINADIQFAVQEILQEAIEKYNAKEAAAVVINPDNGDIVAMVSYPNFDPNQTGTLSIESTKNRPITQSFETGSVIKVFAALAALEEEVVELDEMIDCESTKETKIDGIRVRTVIPNGIIPFLQVIQDSNNIGTVKVVKRVGETLYDYYQEVGFGKSTDLGFPGEQKGFVNHPVNWSRYSIVSLSFGYEITTTLLQLARAYSIFINGEYYVQPRLLKTQPVKKEKLFYEKETIQDMREILQSSIEQGTGKRARIKNYKILGKTGTANILENKTYNESKNLYTFIGSIEKENYRRVITAYIRETEKKSYSSVVAAPLFRKIAEATALHERAL